MRTLTTLLIAILWAVPAHAQKKQSQEPPQPQQDDHEILRRASNARKEVDNWTDVSAVGLKEKLQQYYYFHSSEGVDVKKAERLLNQLEVDTKNEKHWEETVWTIPNSELFPGEMIESHLGTFLVIHGTGRTLRQRFPDCGKTKVCATPTEISDTDEANYNVEAPLDVKAHIFMEGLRHGISHWVAIQDFLGEPPMAALELSWNAVWFDARNVYCRRSPGSKYFDLSNEEQICK